MAGRRISNFLIAALLAACAGSGGSGMAPVPGDFVRVTEWSAAERALQLGRHEGWRYLRRRFPALDVPEKAAWMTTPVGVRRRDVPGGTDWWFRFEAPEHGPWFELVVLVSGGIQGLDAGASR